MADTKVGIVTGAASGMGMALATHFSAKGWRLALFDVNDKAGEELATKLGPNTFFVHCDVSSYASQAAAFKAVWARWGRIDALLANAGITERSSVFVFRHRANAVDDVPPEPDLSCTDVDYKGILYGVQLAIHFMRHNAIPGGKIVVTASVAGIHPHPTFPEYNGAKAAVIQFVRSAADILHNKENIRINAVCPGIVATTIIPAGMVAAANQDALTPVDTIVAAYEHCLADENTEFGLILETTGKLYTPMDYTQLKYKNGVSSTEAVVVWEPLFKTIHGEESELPGAVA